MEGIRCNDFGVVFARLFETHEMPHRKDIHKAKVAFKHVMRMMCWGLVNKNNKIVRCNLS